jgi:hypothetical protein
MEVKVITEPIYSIVFNKQEYELLVDYFSSRFKNNDILENEHVFEKFMYKHLPSYVNN